MTAPPSPQNHVSKNPPKRLRRPPGSMRNPRSFRLNPASSPQSSRNRSCRGCTSSNRRTLEWNYQVERTRHPLRLLLSRALWSTVENPPAIHAVQSPTVRHAPLNRTVRPERQSIWRTSAWQRIVRTYTRRSSVLLLQQEACRKVWTGTLRPWGLAQREVKKCLKNVGRTALRLKGAAADTQDNVGKDVLR